MSLTDSEKKAAELAAWQKELESRGIHRRYWNCTFQEIERRGLPAQVQRQYGTVKEYADHLGRYVEEGVGLILKGPVGTMKSTFAVAVLQEYLRSGGAGLFIPMVSLLDNIFTLKEQNKAAWAKYEERIRTTGILVLDDLGTEYHQEWVLSKVSAIISERYDRMKPMIITTNLTNEALKQTYAERIYDRLKSTSKVINFAGDSLRETA